MLCHIIMTKVKIWHLKICMINLVHSILKHVVELIPHHHHFLITFTLRFLSNQLRTSHWRWWCSIAERIKTNRREKWRIRSFVSHAISLLYTSLWKCDLSPIYRIRKNIPHAINLSLNFIYKSIFFTLFNSYPFFYWTGFISRAFYDYYPRLSGKKKIIETHFYKYSKAISLRFTQILFIYKKLVRVISRLWCHNVNIVATTQEP
jgi:hypothetical protein